MMAKRGYDDYVRSALETLDQDMKDKPFARLSMRIQGAVNCAMADTMVECTGEGLEAADVYDGMVDGLASCLVTLHLNAMVNGANKAGAKSQTAKAMIDLCKLVMEKIDSGAKGTEMGHVNAGGRDN